MIVNTLMALAEDQQHARARRCRSGASNGIDRGRRLSRRSRTDCERSRESPSRPRERRDSDLFRAPLPRPNLPIPDHAAGGDGTDQHASDVPPMCRSASRSRGPCGSTARRRQTGKNCTVTTLTRPSPIAENFIGQERIADVFSAVRRDQRNAARGGDAEPAGRERQRRRLESRERHPAPEPEQAQIEHEHGAEQRRYTQGCGRD